jgi:hypothetical protein
MASSPLPLSAWFMAIQTVVQKPDITAADLARRAGIDRPATAQRVLNKIRGGLLADDAGHQLAGLVTNRRGQNAV